MPTPTRYTKAGDVSIAWTEHGEGPIDLVFCSGYLSHVEHLFTHPVAAGLFDRLARFSRVLVFDRRGSGLSDRIVLTPTLEEQMEDVLAVMDAAGSERAALVGFTGGAALAILAAATFPARCSALVLLMAFARNLRDPGYEFAQSSEERAVLRETLFETWGQGLRAAALFPARAAADPSFVEWFGALERLSAGPGDARRVFGLLDEVDVRDILPSVRVPTLVMHPREPGFLDVRHSQYLAEAIPGARFAQYPGADALPTKREDREAYVGEIEEFLTGARSSAPVDRALATVLFTDIVGSTRLQAGKGDDAWAEALDRHERLVRAALGRWGGRAVKSLGDGFLATFDGPTSAVSCALDLSRSLEASGLPIRAGVHTGEVEWVGDDVRGIAVNIGARVSALGDAGEVLVSQTVKDLIVGSSIGLEDRGEHELKGVPGTWRVHRASADEHR
ncbi:MAG: adenylate/guanylate cyclase domain-containing protein [Solirubrobacteraceae bacterium]